MGTENWGVVAIGGFGAFISCILYMLGGTSGFNKGIRRFGSSFFLSLSANLVAIFLGRWVWQYALMLPALILAFCMGYGADTTWQKILRRSVYAVGVLLACLCGFWAVGGTIGAWIVLGCAFLAGITSIVLGVFNPFNNARVEEYLVCQVLTLFVPFWAFVG